MGDPKFFIWKPVKRSGTQIFRKQKYNLVSNCLYNFYTLRNNRVHIINITVF